MTQPTSDTIRAATYLAEKDRIDAPTGRKLSTRTGKTKRKVTCTPPNKKCGGRCIPPSWDCRLTGQGTNSELRTHRQDPSAGIASIQRGAKDIAGGVVQADPAKFERGRSSVIRGVVKLSPGDNLEEKKKLRRKLESRSSAVAGVVSVGLLTVGAHFTAKKIFPGYRSGWGRSADMAVKGAYGSVMDRVPFVGANRERVRAAGFSAISGLGIQQIRGTKLQQQARALTIANPTTPGRVSRLVGGLRSNPFTGSGALVEYDEFVAGKSNKAPSSLTDFRNEGAAIIFSAKDKKTGNSVFAPDATNALITKQWRLSPEGLSAVGTSPFQRRQAVTGHLSTKLQDVAGAMKKDMAQRGMDAAAYTKAVIDTTLDKSMKGASKRERSAARQFSIQLLKSDGNIGTTNNLAKGLIAQTEYQVNDHISTLNTGLRRKSNFGDSPRDESQVGFATFLMKQNRGTGTKVGAGRIISPEHAELYTRATHARKVAQDTKPIEVTRGMAARVATQLNAGKAPTSPEETLKTLETQGGIRARFSPTSSSATPSFSRTGKRSSKGAGAQSNLSNLARSIMGRKGNENMTMEQAMRIAKSERGDSAAHPPRVAAYVQTREDLEKEGKGKKCGESHIAKSHECTIGKTKKGERSAAYRARQVSSIALRTAAVGGGAALAAYGLTSKKGGMDVSTRMSLALYGSAISGLSVLSLKNERNSTKSPKQFAAEIRKLEKMPDAEPETVKKFAEFVEEAGIDQQRVGIKVSLGGVKGYFDTGKPNRLQATDLTKQGMTDKDYQAMGGAMRGYMSDRKAKTPEQQDARNISKTNMKALQDNWGPVASFAGKEELNNSYGTYIKVHELGHAIHYRGDFKTPSRVVVGGKSYQGDALERELRKSVGIYGQTDIRRDPKKVTKTDYYSQGNRLETFAENFAMYSLSGKQMKKDFPVAYEWTKQTFEDSLAKPVKKNPIPMKDMIQKQGYAGFGTFDPYEKRRDAETALAAVFADLQKAASTGNMKAAMSTFTENGARMSEPQLAIALQWIEASRVTAKALESEPKEEKPKKPRGDAEELTPRARSYKQVREDLEKRSKGKKCGGSYITKTYTCSKGGQTANASDEAPPSSKRKYIKIAAAALALGAASGAIAVAWDAHQLKTGMGLPATRSFKQVMTRYRRENGLSGVPNQEVYGRYYDDLVQKEGWKVGEIVYERSPRSQGGHFAVYAGKTKRSPDSDVTAHTFISFGRAVSKTRSGSMWAEEYGPGADLSAASAFRRVPKAYRSPIKYNQDELLNRTEALWGRPIKYNVFTNNCEHWARALVGDVPRSRATDRLTAVTKTYVKIMRPRAREVYFPGEASARDVAREFAKGDPSSSSASSWDWLLSSKGRSDAIDIPEIGLISPKEVIEGANSGIEAVSRVKRYLMVLNGMMAKAKQAELKEADATG